MILKGNEKGDLARERNETMRCEKGRGKLFQEKKEKSPIEGLGEGGRLENHKTKTPNNSAFHIDKGEEMLVKNSEKGPV